MRIINKIIFHCSTTREGEHVTIKQIDNWHKQRGQPGIGYHYVIHIDGSIHEGRKLRERSIGYHLHHADSIDICYVGGLDQDGNDKDTRTEAQRHTLEGIIELLQNEYPQATVHAHSEFSNKVCSCCDVHKEYTNEILHEEQKIR